MPIRMLIADDSALARSAIAGALAGEPDLQVVAEAQDGYEALALVRDLQPDLVLLDINMPRCDGLLACRLIKRQWPKIIVVMLTVSDDATDLFQAIRDGAQGYLLKSLAPADWVAYLRGFALGDWAMPPEMAARLLADLHPPGAAPAPTGGGTLTDREMQVLRLVGRAMTNREIAETLGISEQTVKNHLKNMVAKLHLKNRVGLAVFARNLAGGTTT
jgi:two-component system, NarL family, nitrate/nitrite response regulator NarL